MRCKTGPFPLQCLMRQAWAQASQERLAFPAGSRGFGTRNAIDLNGDSPSGQKIGAVATPSLLAIDNALWRQRRIRNVDDEITTQVEGGAAADRSTLH